MRLIDLTLPIPKTRAASRDVRIRGARGSDYTGVVYDFELNSMDGTYIDFPGHIRETDDGRDAANYPVDALYRRSAAVIHLDRASGSGPVTAADLRQALPGTLDPPFPALILNALGRRRFDQIENRSVFLTLDAVHWIADCGVRLLVSDIYESRAIHGVFLELFRRGVAAVCLPINLDKIDRPAVRLTVFPLPIPGVTQLPCRVVAELGETAAHEYAGDSGHDQE